MNTHLYWISGAIFGAAFCYMVMSTVKTSKPHGSAQATKDNAAQVELHIARQRKLGERMIRDNDEPTAIDLIVTAMFVLAVLAAWAMGWM